MATLAHLYCPLLARCDQTGRPRIVTQPSILLSRYRGDEETRSIFPPVPSETFLVFLESIGQELLEASGGLPSSTHLVIEVVLTN